MQLIFFLASLIPMCIIAWKFDAAGLLRENEPVVRVRPQTTTRVITRPTRYGVPENRANALSSLATAEPRQSAPEPIERAEQTANKVYPAGLRRIGDPRPPRSIPLSFTKSIHVAETSFAKARVTRVGTHEFSTSTDDGRLPCVITINSGPRPITLALAIDDDGTIRMRPRVATDRARAVPFTTANLQAVIRRIQQNGRAASQQLAALEAEQVRVNGFLAAEMPKAVPALNAAAERRIVLSTAVPAQQKVVSQLAAELVATQELLNFAEELEGCVMTLEEMAD